MRDAGCTQEIPKKALFRVNISQEVEFLHSACKYCAEQIAVFILHPMHSHANAAILTPGISMREKREQKKEYIPT